MSALSCGKFDEDGSNAVSTTEMKNMIKQLKLNMTDEEIEKLMAEADPDGKYQRSVGDHASLCCSSKPASAAAAYVPSLIPRPSRLGSDRV